MTLHRLTPALLSALTALVACGGEPASDDPETNEDGFELVYERQALTAGATIDRAKVDALVEANTISALRFHKKIRESEEGSNFTFSPFGISRAFSGYYDPSRAEVAAAFEYLFGFTAQSTSEEAWQMASYEAMYRDVGADADPSTYSTFMSNDIYWIDEKSDSGNNLNFDRIHKLPLESDPEAARKVINAWISKRTFGLIPEFYATLPSALVAITSNVLFFKGPWRDDFNTSTVDFQGSSIPALTGAAGIQRAENDDAILAIVSFQDRYDFVVLMPKNDLDAYVDGLEPAAWRSLLSSADYAFVDLTMPTFDITTNPDLSGAVNALRDESNTAGPTLTGAYMEDYKQEAVIKLDHEGVEAAAVTVIEEYVNGDPGPMIPDEELVIDKPFVFMVRDGKSGSILFMGEFTNQ